MINNLYEEEWFKNNYFIHLFAYYSRRWENFVMPVQVHNRIEIMYVIKGKCTIEAENRQYQLINGDYILVNANIPHRIIMQKDEHCRMLNAEFGFTKNSCDIPSIGYLLGSDFCETKLFMEKKNHIVFKDHSDIYNYLKLLVNEISRNGGKSTRIVQLHVAQLLLKLSEAYEENTYTKSVKSIVHIRKAISYIQSHYFDDVKIDKLAKHVGVHTNYLQRIFKENMNETIVDYLTKIRIEKAKELLSSTDIAIIDICLYVGINSRQYFTYLFKKHLGMTPRQYRKSFIQSSFD